MFFEFSLMEEEGLVPPDVIAVILEKFNARLEFARSLQMHNQSVDYWESALRFGFAFGCVVFLAALPPLAHTPLQLRCLQQLHLSHNRPAGAV